MTHLYPPLLRTRANEIRIYIRYFPDTLWFSTG
jgi:hypothetical protein